MKRTVFSLLSVLVVLSMLFSLSAVAFADGFERDQYYEEDRNGEIVYTVQISATESLSGAENLRNRMLGLGFDCFVYNSYGLYHVMCGKFYSKADAETYRNAIIGSTDRSSAYVTTALLPAGLVEAFAEVYSDGLNIVTQNDADKMPHRAMVDLALAPNTFASGQYYEADVNQWCIFTIQVSAHVGLGTAEADRDKMLAKGYDSFVYYNGCMYYVMCGKFPTPYEALCYGESIHTDPSRYSAYMNTALLPLSAVNTFTTQLAKYVTIPQDARRMETFWEQPTGAYYRGDAEDTVEVYTVEFSEGTSFASSEQHRDRMSANGFPAFVYKLNMTYKTLTGMFTDKAAADSYCAEVRSSGQGNAIVTTALLPQEAVDTFQSWYAER